MLILQELRARILDGGDPDLYRGIRGLGRRAPVTPEILATYMRVAMAIRDRFPQRVKEPLRHPYDAQIVVMEFGDHPDTTRQDILRVLDNCQ